MATRLEDRALMDMDIDRAAHRITLRRMFAASPEAVFDAWVEPGQIARWWDPVGEPLAACEIDLRPGGAFSLVNRSHPDRPFRGIYVRIERPSQLVFEANGAIGTVSIEALAGGTLMTVTLACSSEGQLEQFIRMGIDTGTARTLDNLVAYLDVPD